MRALFGAHVLHSPSEEGIAFDITEDGRSFLENALKKAQALQRQCGMPVLADDSGLCVDALGGAPGLHSARYGSLDGRTLEASARNARLLEAMRGVQDRSCRFVCCLVLVSSPDRFLAVQETMEGELLEEPRGQGGFGYDPIVLVKSRGLSVAELTEEEKNRISHRGKAAAAMLRLIAGF
jgi:XTP/dITP diphosphohydrolase